MRMNNTLWGMIDKIIQVFFSFAPLFFIGRVFSKDDIGNYALSSMFLTSIYLLTYTSSRSVYIKYINSYGNAFRRRFYYPYIIDKIFITIFMYLLVSVYLYVNSSLNIYIFFSMLVYIIIQFESLSWELENQYKQNVIVVYRCIVLCVGIFFKLLAIYYNNLMAVILITSFESFVFYVLLRVYFYKNTSVLEIKNKSVCFLSWFFITKKIYPLYLSALMIFLYGRIDQIMIFKMIGAEELADYSMAQKIIEPLSIIPVAICATALPFLMKINSNKTMQNQLARGYFFILFVIGIILFLIYKFFGWYIVSFLFGSKFSSIQNIINITSMTIPISFIAIYNGMLLVIYDLQKLAPVRSLLGVVINVVSNIILIPKFGVIGAAVSSLTTLLLSGCIFYYISPKCHNIAKINLYGLSFKYVRGIKL